MKNATITITSTMWAFLQSTIGLLRLDHDLPLGYEWGQLTGCRYGTLYYEH